jgi:hypothetical protein
MEEEQITKGKWTEEEDRLLKQAVDLIGDKEWKIVGTYVKGRSSI